MQIQYIVKAKQPEIYAILQGLRGNLKNSGLLEAATLTDEQKKTASIMTEKKAVEVVVD